MISKHNSGDALNIRDVLFGAAISLAVSVAGGVSVYYLTKEQKYTNKEYLVYSVQGGGIFSGKNTKLALSALRLSNDGGKPAKNVSINLDYEKSEISDISFNKKLESGAYTISKDKKSVQIKLEDILPDEIIVTNILLTSPDNPNVFIRSDKSAAISLENVKVTNLNLKEALAKVIPVLISIVGLFILLFLLQRSRGGIIFNSKNNTGFMFLHFGLVDEAKEVLMLGAKAGQYDAYLFSNLAVCSALEGDFEAAKKYLNAANFRKLVGHTKGVALFNESLVLLLSGSKDEAMIKLQEAMAASPKHVQRYCYKSIHFEDIRKDSEFRRILNQD